MFEITPQSKVCDVLEKIEGAKEIFLKLGYKCVDCAVNIEDTLAIASLYHKKNLDELLLLLNQLQTKNSR
jgi:hypothetical protein